MIAYSYTITNDDIRVLADEIMPNADLLTDSECMTIGLEISNRCSTAHDLIHAALFDVVTDLLD